MHEHSIDGKGKKSVFIAVFAKEGYPNKIVPLEVKYDFRIK